MVEWEKKFNCFYSNDAGNGAFPNERERLIEMVLPVSTMDFMFDLT